MKKIFLFVGIFALLSILTLKAQVTIGVNQAPDPSALLDLQSRGNLGLLLPRVVLTDTLLAAPLPSNVPGMMVYNTTASADGKVVEGVYINDGRRWWQANGGVAGPWDASGTKTAARLNTQDIYQTGRVTIGMDTLQSVTMLNVVSDNKGIMIPRMSLEQRNAIDTTNANSLMIYNTDEDCYNYYSRSIGDWQSLCGGMAKAAFTVASCDSITVNGAYIEGTPLNGSNYLSMTVNVTKAGSYSITVTTSNGYGFTGSGTILDAPATVVLMIPGQGTPKVKNQSPGDLVTFSSSGGDVNCSTLTIPVLPSVATYDITCGSIKANGAYVKNVMLDPTKNTLTLLVNVINIDNGANSWTIRTNVNNGISFLGSGTFNATGVQQVTLQGAGTPNTTDPIPLTLTANSASGESTCNTIINIAYPTMTVYGVGSGNGYNYNPAAGANNRPSSPHKFTDMMTAQNNYGTQDSSTVKSQGFTFTDGGNNPSNAVLQAALTAPNPPDIVIFGYPFSGDATTAQIILDYLNRKGVVLFYAESATMVQNMMRALFGDNTITAAQNGGSGGARYLMPMLPMDPIINGPFGNIGGMYWGEDASTSVTVAGIQYNPNATIYSTYFNTNGTGGVTAFRHNSMNFMYCGDGGFNSCNNTTSQTICPFLTDSNNVPIPKPSYGGSSGTSGTPPGPVYNSIFTANAIAWALDKAMNNGINPH